MPSDLVLVWALSSIAEMRGFERVTEIRHHVSTSSTPDTSDFVRPEQTARDSNWFHTVYLQWSHWSPLNMNLGYCSLYSNLLLLVDVTAEISNRAAVKYRELGWCGDVTQLRPYSLPSLSVCYICQCVNAPCCHWRYALLLRCTLPRSWRWSI
jgi:hypothetical protein